jgi:hypothetical protein
VLRFGRFIGMVSAEENTYFLRAFEAVTEALSSGSIFAATRPEARRNSPVPPSREIA